MVNLELDESWLAIERLDLSGPLSKLESKEHGEGWSSERCKNAEKEYRRFLYLNKVNQAQGCIVPSPDADKLWHHHILDTRKYQEDCERVLGFFLHHYPYLGLRFSGDEENLNIENERSYALYLETFSESYGLAGNVQLTAPTCSGSYPPPGSPPPPPPPPTCAGSYPPPPPPYNPQR